MNKINLSPEIYDKFRDYHQRLSTWGVFHIALNDGNFELGAFVPGNDYNIISAEEKELVEIFNQLSFNQRKKIANRC